MSTALAPLALWLSEIKGSVKNTLPELLGALETYLEATQFSELNKVLVMLTDGFITNALDISNNLRSPPDKTFAG